MKKDAGYSVARWTLLVAVAAVLGAGTSRVTSAQIKLAPLPLPFNRIQCADLRGWRGDPAAAATLVPRLAAEEVSMR